MLPGARAESVPLAAGFLIEDGLFNTELTAPLDVFQHTPAHAKPGVRVFTIARSMAPIRTFEGLLITPDYTYDSAPKIDILVIPSAARHVTEDFDDKALLSFVRARAETASHVLSLCDGAFVLAHAGLLDGRYCTTYPGDIQALRERFPATNVVEGVSFAVDGKWITSNGGARSFEPALYLVEDLYGRKAARAVATGLVIDWERERTAHYVHRKDAFGYRPGDVIASDAVVQAASGEDVRLLSLAGDEDRILVLILFGGGAPKSRTPRGGLWCEDSLNELGLIRHMMARFEHRGVRFVPVACPPVYDEVRFGFDQGSFSASGPSYETSTAALVETTEAATRSGVLPFAECWYDFRFLLARAPRRIDEGEERGWVGRFRAPGEEQVYGTPTIWILGRDGTVLTPPFHGNNYEVDVPLRHTSDDVESAIRAALERSGP